MQIFSTTLMLHFYGPKASFWGKKVIKRQNQDALPYPNTKEKQILREIKRSNCNILKVVGPKRNPAVLQMSQLTSQKMHDPRQRAVIFSTGSLRTTVGQSMTRHTAEVWSLTGGEAPRSNAFERSRCITSSSRPPAIKYRISW